MTEKEAIINQIDALDQELLSLLNQRQSLAQAIGRIKGREGQGTLDFQREEEVLAHLMHLNPGPLSPSALRNIFREIISAAREIQGALGVAFLGPEATFSHLAAVKYFGHAAKFMPMPTIEDIFHDVEHGRIRYGIIPVENSIEGSVTSALDSFIKYRVKICGEVNLAIKHNLVNYSGNIEDIRQVVSHPQPLAQCREWLRKNLPDVPTQNVFSTGTAAQMANHDHALAAVASDLAIKTYDLQVVARGIEDYRGNTTRFLLIGDKSPSRSGRDKTSLLLSLIDRPGALYHTLNIMADQGVNLTKIESRPVKGEAGKYMFFIDILGHIEDEVIDKTCARLRETCASFEWLGSYPQMAEDDN